MNRDGADDVLFGAALSCEESQRAAFVAHDVDPALAEAACVRAEACLHAIAVIEDSRTDDEDGPQSLALRRIEARLDLLTALVGALARRDQPDPLVPLRWSAVGACLPAQAAETEGTTGTFRVQAAAWLPEPLELPAIVIASHADRDGTPRLWIRFGPLTAGAAAALERHLFRQHRRAIAEKRRQA